MLIGEGSSEQDARPGVDSPVVVELSGGDLVERAVSTRRCVITDQDVHVAELRYSCVDDLLRRLRLGEVGMYIGDPGVVDGKASS